MEKIKTCLKVNKGKYFAINRSGQLYNQNRRLVLDNKTYFLRDEVDVHVGCGQTSQSYVFRLSEDDVRTNFSFRTFSIKSRGYVLALKTGESSQ